MRGFKAEALNGLCYTGNELAGTPFPTMAASVVVCTTQLAAPITEQSGYCDDTIIFRWGPGISKSAYVYATDYAYGTTSKNIIMNTNYKFDLEEVKEWDPKTVLPFGVPPSLPYTITYEGPRWLNPSAYIPLANVELPTTEPERKTMLDQFLNIDWMDNLTDPYNAGVDWLGVAWPGGWIYAPENMPTPFLATGYYEDSGRELNWDDNDVHMWQLPFCNPLSIYNKQDELWGKLKGLAFIPFFSTGICKEPFCGRPIDPSRPWDPETHPYPFRLRSTVQYLNVELWIYAGMQTEEGKDQIKSPRIARARWWFFTQPNGTGDPTPNVPFEPYMFLQCGNTPVGAKWLLPFLFTLREGATNPDNLTEYNTRLSLSNFGLRLGA
jgi:hypothetical protein